jgi:hypothetical protein
MPAEPDWQTSRIVSARSEERYVENGTTLGPAPRALGSPSRDPAGGTGVDVVPPCTGSTRAKRSQGERRYRRHRPAEIQRIGSCSHLRSEQPRSTAEIGTAEIGTAEIGTSEFGTSALWNRDATTGRPTRLLLESIVKAKAPSRGKSSRRPLGSKYANRGGEGTSGHFCTLLRARCDWHGPSIGLAGNDTGPTNTLVQRLAHVIDHTACEPGQIIVGALYHRPIAVFPAFRSSGRILGSGLRRHSPACLTDTQRQPFNELNTRREWVPVQPILYSLASWNGPQYPLGESQSGEPCNDRGRSCGHQAHAPHTVRS